MRSSVILCLALTGDELFFMPIVKNNQVNYQARNSITADRAFRLASLDIS
jgi:hypothetical protein